MRLLPIVPLVAALALAGCNRRSVDLKDVTPDQARAAVAKAGASFLVPGQWNATMTVDQFDSPALAPADAARFKAMMAGQGSRTVPICVGKTDQDSAVTQLVQGAMGDCKYSHFQIGGGAIDTDLVCHMGATTRHITLAGHYDATSYTANSTATTSGGSGPLGQTSSKLTLNAVRTGDCTPAPMPPLAPPAAPAPAR